MIMFCVFTRQNHVQNTLQISVLGACPMKKWQYSDGDVEEFLVVAWNALTTAFAASIASVRPFAFYLPWHLFVFRIRTKAQTPAAHFWFGLRRDRIRRRIYGIRKDALWSRADAFRAYATTRPLNPNDVSVIRTMTVQSERDIDGSLTATWNNLPPHSGHASQMFFHLHLPSHVSLCFAHQTWHLPLAFSFPREPMSESWKDDCRFHNSTTE